MIARITRAYVRHYRDNEQTIAYVDWIDTKGNTGRTQAAVRSNSGTLAECYGLHMGALFARAICTGIEIERETW